MGPTDPTTPGRGAPLVDPPMVVMDESEDPDKRRINRLMVMRFQFHTRSQSHQQQRLFLFHFHFGCVPKPLCHV